MRFAYFLHFGALGGALATGRAELRQVHSRFVGTAANFPEKCGPKVIRLALDILERKATPPVVFTRHQIITPGNVDHLHPNDALMTVIKTPA